MVENGMKKWYIIFVGGKSKSCYSNYLNESGLVSIGNTVGVEDGFRGRRSKSNTP